MSKVSIRFCKLSVRETALVAVVTATLTLLGLAPLIVMVVL